MRTINTQVATYSPDITYTNYQKEGEPFACMFHDFEGLWVMHRDHETVVEMLQQRITYLENCLDEAHDMLCR